MPTPPLPEHTSVELHPTRLLRAAQGDRSLEAAIVLLADADLLAALHCAITVDTDRNLAWIDWPAALTVAERTTPQHLALIRLAATLAEDASPALQHHCRSIQRALRHLGL